MTGTEANFQPIENGDILKARMKGVNKVFPDYYDRTISAGMSLFH